MVNTELMQKQLQKKFDYNILNIVVNTEPEVLTNKFLANYNILNIVVNTEQKH